MTELTRLTQEWLQRGEHDLRTARIALEGGAPSDTVRVLLYQGWELRKTHNLVFLLGEAVKYDTGFSSFVDLAGKLTTTILRSGIPLVRLLSIPLWRQKSFWCKASCSSPNSPEP